ALAVGVRRGVTGGALGVALLDLGEAGEVGVDVEGDDRAHRLGTVVAQLDGLVQAGAYDAAAAQHHQGAVGPAAARGSAQGEDGAILVGLGDRQRLRRVAADAQLPARQDPGVADEDALGPAGVDVAVVPG